LERKEDGQALHHGLTVQSIFLIDGFRMMENKLWMWGVWGDLQNGEVPMGFAFPWLM
jgi:hypothetical protein